MSDIAIKVENISKRYQIKHASQRQDTLRDTIAVALQSLNLRKKKYSKDDHDYIWALKDISFEVERGEVIGIIGSNGAGKTTLLKILSRITIPKTGRAVVNGRIGPLIEIGAGFHPELTGRENIYLNGAILGMSRDEINRKFDKIVEFSEIGNFLDTPVKRYSSGMYVRLGFSVAAHLEPDILIIDEVLAVGDVNFRRKCYNFIHNFVNSGRTTLIVSHNMYAIENLCEKILWLEQGKIKKLGESNQIIAAYIKDQNKKLTKFDPELISESTLLRITNVNVSDSSGNQKKEFVSGENITVTIEYDANQRIQNPHFVLSIFDISTRQSLSIASMLVDNRTPLEIFGKGRISCQFKSPPLMPRSYQVWGEVYGTDRKRILIRWQPFATFEIMGEERNGRKRGSIRHEYLDAPVRVPYEWHFSSDD